MEARATKDHDVPDRYKRYSLSWHVLCMPFGFVSVLLSRLAQQVLLL